MHICMKQCTNSYTDFYKFVQSVLVNKFKQLITMCNILTNEIIEMKQYNWLS